MESLTLKDWTINFVKHKDILQKKLQSFDVRENIMVFRFSDKKVKYMVTEDLGSSVLEFVKSSGYKSVVCLSRRGNLKFLVDNWLMLKKIPDLYFVFVDVRRNTRWIISPNVHDKICDENSLVLGIKTMYSSVFP